MPYTFKLVSGVTRYSAKYTEAVLDISDIVKDMSNLNTMSDACYALARSRSAVVRKVFKQHTLDFGVKLEHSWDLRAVCLDTSNKEAERKIVQAFIAWQESYIDTERRTGADIKSIQMQLCNSYIVETNLNIVFCYNRVLSARLFSLLQLPNLVAHQSDTSGTFFYRCGSCSSVSQATSIEGKLLTLKDLPASSKCTHCGSVCTISKTLNVTSTMS